VPCISFLLHIPFCTPAFLLSVTTLHLHVNSVDTYPVLEYTPPQSASVAQPSVLWQLVESHFLSSASVKYVIQICYSYWLQRMAVSSQIFNPVRGSLQLYIAVSHFRQYQCECKSTLHCTTWSLAACIDVSLL